MLKANPKTSFRALYCKLKCKDLTCDDVPGLRGAAGPGLVPCGQGDGVDLSTVQRGDDAEGLGRGAVLAHVGEGHVAVGAVGRLPVQGHLLTAARAARPEDLGRLWPRRTCMHGPWMNQNQLLVSHQSYT